MKAQKEAYKGEIVCLFFVIKKWKMHLYLNGIYVGKVSVQ